MSGDGGLAQGLDCRCWEVNVFLRRSCQAQLLTMWGQGREGGPEEAPGAVCTPCAVGWRNQDFGLGPASLGWNGKEALGHGSLGPWICLLSLSLLLCTEDDHPTCPLPGCQGGGLGRGASAGSTLTPTLFHPCISFLLLLPPLSSPPPQHSRKEAHEGAHSKKRGSAWATLEPAGLSRACSVGSEEAGLYRQACLHLTRLSLWVRAVFVDGLELVARTAVTVMVGHVSRAYSDGGILLQREETEVLGRND